MSSEKAPMVHTPHAIAAYEELSKHHGKKPWNKLSTVEQDILIGMFLAGANWMSKIVAEKL